jgi:hypothetical protein
VSPCARNPVRALPAFAGQQGKFQLLVNGVTEFGPGDPGYLGGRWWEDLNQNGMQDQGDHFFLCLLIPPGRPSPNPQARPIGMGFVQ